MQYWIGLAFTVPVRLRHSAEPQMLIEADCLCVLRVHVHFGYTSFMQDVGNQRFANPFPTVGIVDEQHFYIVPGRADESRQPSVLLISQQGDLGEIGGHKPFVVQEIFFCQEIVCMQHRAFPNLHQTWIVCRSYGSNHIQFFVVQKYETKSG